MISNPTFNHEASSPELLARTTPVSLGPVAEGSILQVPQPPMLHAHQRLQTGLDQEVGTSRRAQVMVSNPCFVAETAPAAGSKATPFALPCEVVATISGSTRDTDDDEYESATEASPRPSTSGHEGPVATGISLPPKGTPAWQADDPALSLRVFKNNALGELFKSGIIPKQRGPVLEKSNSPVSTTVRKPNPPASSSERADPLQRLTTSSPATM